jgi:hypothetical protein
MTRGFWLRDRPAQGSHSGAEIRRSVRLATKIVILGRGRVGQAGGVRTCGGAGVWLYGRADVRTSERDSDAQRTLTGGEVQLGDASGGLEVVGGQGYPVEGLR